MRGGTVISIVLIHTLIKLGGDTNTILNNVITMKTNTIIHQVTGLSATFATNRTTTQANA